MVALVLQFVLAGISADTLRLCLVHAASTIAGILVGGFFGKRIPEQIFHWILMIILISTVIILFSTLG